MTTIHYVRHCLRFIDLLSRARSHSLACVPILLDERLGKLFKALPPTEDVYVYQNNGPSFDSA